MYVLCPNCGSRHVRHSKLKTAFERLCSLFGYHMLRCKDCQHRFGQRVWKLADVRWSRCPRCYRTDLSTWSEDHYLPRFWTLAMIRLGAKRLRCEYCRFNFSGFRPVKQRYQHPSRRKGPRQAPEGPAPDEAASVDVA